MGDIFGGILSLVRFINYQNKNRGLEVNFYFQKKKSNPKKSNPKNPIQKIQSEKTESKNQTQKKSNS